MDLLRWFRRPIKKQVNQSLYRHVDSHNRQLAPDDAQLVKDYEGVAYTCANKNAHGLARTKLRLYVKSAQGQKTRWKSNKIVKTTRSWLDRKFSFANDETVVEVIDPTHPILKLLGQPNDAHDGKAFLRYSQLYLEIVGGAYWRLNLNALDVPQSMWILPPQQVTRLDKGKIAFRDGSGLHTYPTPNIKIVHLTFDNLQDPYGLGYSPLRAMWEQHNIANKLLAHMGTQLDNQARPDTLVLGDFGDDEAERYEHKINSKFRQNNGGIAVMSTDADGKPTITPLTFSPRDMSILQMLGYTKVEVANAFSVPMAMLESRDVNRANLQASREMHAKDAILPRCDALEVVLNNKLVSLFDPSGRTLLAFDNPSPEDRELDLQEQTAQAQQLTTLVTGSVVTQNEARAELGLEPLDDGDRLIGNVVVNLTESDLAPTPDKPETDKPETETEEPTETQPQAQPVTEQEVETNPSLTLNGAQIQAASGIVSQVAQGLLPRDAGIGQLEVLLNLSREQAERVMASVGQNFIPPDKDSEPADGKGLLILSGDHKCTCSTDPTEKALGHNVKLPSGKAMIPILVKHFIRQQRQVMGSLQKAMVNKKQLPSKFVPIEEWSQELADELFPVVELYIEQGSDKLLADVGASPDVFSISDPNVQEWLKQYTFDFAESTTNTTTKLLNDALDSVRSELAEGLLEGDAINALTRRIQSIFENATKQRSQLIAKTEGQRAYLQGQQKSAIESGVVEGFEHLTSTGACPVCIPLNGKVYGLTDEIPPNNTHPGCECGLLSILIDD